MGRPISAVSGVVWDEAGRPVAGAVVRVKGRTTHTVTDAAGRFALSGFDGARRVHLTAWRDGFYIRGAGAGPFPSSIVIRLSRHTDRDHTGYRWNAPAVAHSSTTRRLIDWALTAADRVAPSLVRPIADRFDTGCRDCHEWAVDEWSGSAHAQGASRIHASSRCTTARPSTAVSHR